MKETSGSIRWAEGNTISLVISSSFSVKFQRQSNILTHSSLESATLVQNPALGLPWWRSGWESACQCRGQGFEPWSGKIPHAAEQLGPWATIAEPAHLEPVLHNKRGRGMRGPCTTMKSGPRSPQLEKALAQKRRPNTAINK